MIFKNPFLTLNILDTLSPEKRMFQKFFFSQLGIFNSTSENTGAD